MVKWGSIFVLLFICAAVLAQRRRKERWSETMFGRGATETQTTVTIGAFLPYSHLGSDSRTYKGRLKASLKEMNYKRKYPLHNDVYLVGRWMLLENYSPERIFNSLCDYFLKLRVNTLIYIPKQYNEEGGSSRAAKNNRYLLSVTQFLGIPTIAWTPEGTGLSTQNQGSELVLQLAPSVAHQVHAMLSILQRYDWLKFAIFVSPMGGSDIFIRQVQKRVEELQIETGKEFFIEEIIEMSAITEYTVNLAMDYLRKTDTRIILLYSSRAEAELVFQGARNHSLTSAEYVWICSRSVVGKTDRSPPYSYPVGMLGLSFQMSLYRLADVIEDAVTIWARGLTRYLPQDLPLNPNISCDSPSGLPWIDGHRLHNAMKETVFMRSYDFGDDRAHTFKEDGTLNDTSLDIVNLKKDHEWKSIGTWDPVNGLELDDITWPGDKASPPSGRPASYKLKIVTLQERPYVNYDDPDPKTGNCTRGAVLCRMAPWEVVKKHPNATRNPLLYQCCSGFCIDLLFKLADKIGFEFELFEVPDQLWGSYDNNTKEWNGLILSLLNRSADLCLTSLKITPQRAQAVDFSVPYLETGITIIVAVRDGVISATAFLEPFDSFTWILILLVGIPCCANAIFFFEWISPYGFNMTRLPIFKGRCASLLSEPYDWQVWLVILIVGVHVCGTVLFILEYLSPSSFASSRLRPDYRFSLFRSFWLTWAVLFGAAVNTDNLRGIASRVMTLFWALFALVFTASYTANLAAFMITKDDFYDLSGLNDRKLVNASLQKPPFRFATVPYGSTEVNIKTHKYEMWEYMQPFNKTTVKKGVEAVRKGELHAFIYDATVLDYLAGEDKDCKLKTVGNWFARTGYGIAFPKYSKWLPVFNKHLLRLQDRGELDRLRRFWLQGACGEKLAKKGERSHPLAIANFTSAFILLGGGMVLGAILLLLEQGYFKFFRHRLRKWNCNFCHLISLSMGASLSFEETVIQSVEATKRYRCSDPLCNAKMRALRTQLAQCKRLVQDLQDERHPPFGGNTELYNQVAVPANTKSLPFKRPQRIPFSQQNGGSGLIMPGSRSSNVSPHYTATEYSSFLHAPPDRRLGKHNDGFSATNPSRGHRRMPGSALSLPTEHSDMSALSVSTTPPYYDLRRQESSPSTTPITSSVSLLPGDQRRGRHSLQRKKRKRERAPSPIPALLLNTMNKIEREEYETNI